MMYPPGVNKSLAARSKWLFHPVCLLSAPEIVSPLFYFFFENKRKSDRYIILAEAPF
jgi:hypothetical protein